MPAAFSKLPPTMIWLPSHVVANERARPLVRGRHVPLSAPAPLKAASRCLVKASTVLNLPAM